MQPRLLDASSERAGLTELQDSIALGGRVV
jgi:hypothetical protein